MQPVTASVERAAFPAGGKRVIFYLLWDARGIVDDYILYKLKHLRPFADHIFVVVNGKLTDEGRERLDTVADTVWRRENVGYDVWGYKSALEEFGDERLSEYDELILMNYTWFGPVNPFEPVFEKMDAQELDFWGMTEYMGQKPNPFTNKGVMHAHLQSHWIAVRSRMFRSEEWKQYWANMPPIRSYIDSILSHESVFTHRFSELGFRYDVAFPGKKYSTNHAAFLDADSLLADGCPALKRRPFFHDPLFLDREAVVASRFIEKAAECGYPIEMIYQNMARNAQPKMLNANAALMEIMPDVDLGFSSS